MKNIARFVQKKLNHTLPEQQQRSRIVSPRPENGGCWPEAGGPKKTLMWQSPGWPVAGKNIPRDAQRLFSHFRNV
jgi:hypothetical protein